MKATTETTGLEAAWAAVEEGLPEGWTLDRLSLADSEWTATAIGPLLPGIGPDEWSGVRIGKGGPGATYEEMDKFHALSEDGEGSTPTAALEALRSRVAAATGWKAAMSDPAFRAALDEGLADVAAGRTKPWAEVRRRWRSR